MDIQIEDGVTPEPSDTIIFVVTSGDYSDYSISGCFSSVDKCKEFMKNHWRDRIKMYQGAIDTRKGELAKPRNQRTKCYDYHYDSHPSLWEGYDYPTDEFYHRDIAIYQNDINKFQYNIDNNVWDEDYRIEEYILDRRARTT